MQATSCDGDLRRFPPRAALTENTLTENTWWMRSG